MGQQHQADMCLDRIVEHRRGIMHVEQEGGIVDNRGRGEQSHRHFGDHQLRKNRWLLRGR